MSEKIAQWSNEIRLLTAIALTQPHAAFAALTHGLSSKWSYLSRTTAGLSSHFQKLEDLLRFQLIPAITGNPAPDDLDRQLFALPAREGGLDIINPASSCDFQYPASRAISELLVKAIMQCREYSYSSPDQLTAKSEVRQQKHLQVKQAAESLKNRLSPTKRRAMELASERGASNWLTALPIEEFGFCLHKGAFADALARSALWVDPYTYSCLLCMWYILHRRACPVLPQRWLPDSPP